MYHIRNALKDGKNSKGDNRMTKYTYTDLLAGFGVGGAHPGSLALTKQTLSKCNLTEKTKVLDVGCGTGQTVAHVARKYGCTVIGVDNNELMLSKMEKRIREANLRPTIVCAKAESLPLESNSFDLVLSESVTAFTDIPASLMEYARVLQPDGMLVLIEMTLANPITEQERKEITEFYGVTDVLTEEEWINQISQFLALVPQWIGDIKKEVPPQV